MGFFFYLHYYSIVYLCCIFNLYSLNIYFYFIYLFIDDLL